MIIVKNITMIHYTSTVERLPVSVIRFVGRWEKKMANIHTGCIKNVPNRKFSLSVILQVSDILR